MDKTNGNDQGRRLTTILLLKIWLLITPILINKSFPLNLLQSIIFLLKSKVH